MDAGNDPEVLEIKDKYVPFLKKLLNFLEKKKANADQVKKVTYIYKVFTTASPQEKKEVFRSNKTKLEKWYANTQKDKMNDDSPLSQQTKRSLQADDTDSSQGVPDGGPAKKAKPESSNQIQETNSNSGLNQQPANAVSSPSEIVFSCASCQFNTSDENDFMKHTRTDHRSDLSMWCKQCGKCFSNAGVLVSHIKEINCLKEEMIYRCGVKDCTFETGSGQTFVHHLRHCHKGSPFIFCKHCQKIFTLPHCLILHMQDDCPYKDLNRKNPGSGVKVTQPTQPVSVLKPVQPIIKTTVRTPVPIVTPPVTPTVTTPSRGRGSLLPTSSSRSRGRGRGRGRGRQISDSSDSDDPDDPSWRPEETSDQTPLRRSGRWAKKLNDAVNVEDLIPAKKSHSMAELNSVNPKNMFQCPCCDFMAAIKSVLSDHYIAHHKVSNKNACTVCQLKFESTQGFLEHFDDHVSGKLTNTPLQVVSNKCESDDKTSQVTNVNGSKSAETFLTEKDDSSEPLPISSTSPKPLDIECCEGVVKNITEAKVSNTSSETSDCIKIPYQISVRDKANRENNFKLFEDMKAPTDLVSMKESKKLVLFFKCPIYSCTFACHDHVSFNIHLTSMHKGKRANCCYCLTSLEAGEALINHMISEHSKRLYQCSNCFYRGYSKMHVKIHITNYHVKDTSTEIYSCEPIDVPSDIKIVDNDIDALTTTWPYVCAVGACSFTSYDPNEFLQHNSVDHRSVSIFYCHYCKVDFISVKRLFYHYRLHGINTFQCNYCIHGSETKSEILNHLCNVHADKPLKAFMRGTEKDVSAEKMLVPFTLETKVEENGETVSNVNAAVAIDKTVDLPLEIEINNLNQINFELLLYDVVGETYYPRHLRKMCTDVICGIPYCRYKSNNILSYVGHLRNVHSSVNFPCPHCAHLSETWEDFKKHLLSHGPDLYACGLVTCGFYDPDKHVVMNHLKEHNHSSAKVVIIREDESVNSEIQQIKSLPSQCPFKLSESSYICFFCGYRSTSEKVMKKHLYHELAYKRFSCNLCNVKLVTRSDVKSHYEVCHSEDTNQFTLQPNPVIEKRVEQLLEKQSVYSDSQSQKCTICKKNFKSVNQFQRHLQLCVNFQYQPYDCEYCKKSFTDIIILKYHMDEKHLHDDMKYSEVFSHEVEAEIDKNLMHLKLAQVSTVLSQDIEQNTLNLYLSKSYKCSMCSYKEDYKFMLQNHVKNSSPCNTAEIIKLESKFEPPKLTDATNKDGTSKVEEKKSQSSDIKAYFCGYCNKKVRNFQEIEDHVEVVHSLENKYYYYFMPDSKAMTISDGKEKYECAYCKTGKIPLSKLKVHSELMHSEMQFKVKGYVTHSRDTLILSACGYCYYRASNTADLKRHLNNSHSNLPSKVFKGFSELMIKRTQEGEDLPNKRVKFGENVFVCGHCGASFSSHDLIATHTKKAHSRLPIDIKKICTSLEKEYIDVIFYKCEFCQFTSERQFLEPHYAAKHKSRVTCGHCDKRFEFATKAREHNEVAHKGLPVKYSQESNTVGVATSQKQLQSDNNSSQKVTDDIKILVPDADSKELIQMSLATFSNLHNINPVVHLQKISL